MKNLTWQNPEQLFVAQELINKVKSKCCGIKDLFFFLLRTSTIRKWMKERNVRTCGIICMERKEGYL